MMTDRRPDSGEYAPYYARYIDRLPEGDILSILKGQLEDTRALLATVSEARAGYRYAPGKWSIREVVGHISDTERIMAYRALRFARGDRTPLAGYEEDDYVRHSDFDRRPLVDLAEELQAVRGATLSLFRGLAPEAWERRGEANGVEVTVRALAYIVAGHELHHRELLRSRYL